jgi:hypothetical protein
VNFGFLSSSSCDERASYNPLIDECAVVQAEGLKELRRRELTILIELVTRVLSEDPRSRCLSKRDRKVSRECELTLVRKP